MADQIFALDRIHPVWTEIALYDFSTRRWMVDHVEARNLPPHPAPRVVAPGRISPIGRSSACALRPWNPRAKPDRLSRITSAGALGAIQTWLVSHWLQGLQTAFAELVEPPASSRSR